MSPFFVVPLLLATPSRGGKGRGLFAVYVFQLTICSAGGLIGSGVGVGVAVLCTVWVWSAALTAKGAKVARASAPSKIVLTRPRLMDWFNFICLLTASSLSLMISH